MKKNKKVIIYIILIFVFISSLSYFGYQKYNDYKDKSVNNFNKEEFKTDKNNSANGEDIKSNRQMLEELRKENEDIIGWLEIKDTNINYPVLQASDNDYYLNHNYKKEKSISGSLFLDASFDVENGGTNYLIYGHRTQNGLMFEDLLKYSKKDFYESHKTFNFTTLKEDATYEIISVFYSRVYYTNEKDVFRYYYFVNAKNEDEFNDFIFNAKKVSIYDTGVSANYKDQLITLSTCEYSKENGRFVVVAKKIKSN